MHLRQKKTFYNPQQKQIQHSWTEIDGLFLFVLWAEQAVCLRAWGIPWHGSHGSHYMYVVSPIVPLAELRTNLSSCCSSNAQRLKVNETIRHNGRAYLQYSLPLYVLVAVIKWFVMFERRLMCNTCYVLVWLMSKPEGAYSEMHSLLFCWHKEIKKINQWSFLSVWWMIHYLCSSVLMPLIKRSCCAPVTPITLDVLHNLTAAFFFTTQSVKNIYIKYI